MSLKGHTQLFSQPIDSILLYNYSVIIKSKMTSNCVKRKKVAPKVQQHVIDILVTYAQQNGTYLFHLIKDTKVFYGDLTNASVLQQITSIKQSKYPIYNSANYLKKVVNRQQ